MANMFKSVDNNTIKAMMQSQGMTLTDEQINMMKNNMNPDIFKMVGNTDFLDNNYSRINNMNNNLNNNNNIPKQRESPPSIEREEEPIQTTQSQRQPTMPNFNDLGSMMKLIQNNPSLMNMMNQQMFGGGMNQGMNQGMQGNNPNDMLMNSMQTILWLISLPQRIKAFFKSPRGILLIVFFLILIISYYYK
jgi:hypothetical protein